MTMSCCTTSIHDYPLSNSSHPCQGSPLPCHRPYATYCQVSDLTKRPTTEQLSASSKHISHIRHHADLTQSPQSLCTARLALNSSDIVGGWGGECLPSCRAFHQPAHTALIHPQIYHPISISYRGMPAVTHHTHTLLSQWRMISYLDFTPITILFLGRATITVFRSSLMGKESCVGRV